MTWGGAQWLVLFWFFLRLSVGPIAKIAGLQMSDNMRYRAKNSPFHIKYMLICIETAISSVVLWWGGFWT